MIELYKKWSSWNREREIPARMNTSKYFDTRLLDDAGLNRHAVFDIAALPEDVRASPAIVEATATRYRQLILIGHAGRALWDAVTASGIRSDDPIDDFTVRTVHRWFAERQPDNAFEILYPGPRLIGLQRLGQLAGWHHATPFMVGIDRKWGSWFAYRAVVLADTDFAPTPAVVSDHPCMTCEEKICIASCPGGAMGEGSFDLDKCVGYRKQEDSACKASCMARLSCPVGAEHRYRDEQIRHTYSISMRAIERYY